VLKVTVGDMAGVVKATVCRVIHKVAHAIALLQRVEVIFPTTQEDRAMTMRQFHEIAQFPAVLGAIDCKYSIVKNCHGSRNS
jgi:hypothetical protein